MISTLVLVLNEVPIDNVSFMDERTLQPLDGGTTLFKLAPRESPMSGVRRLRDIIPADGEVYYLARLLRMTPGHFLES